MILAHGIARVHRRPANLIGIHQGTGRSRLADDELAGEVLEAYVVLREGVEGDDDKAEELQRWVKTEFAAHAFPRKVHFARELPKTPSGKIQRFLLRKERGAR